MTIKAIQQTPHFNGLIMYSVPKSKLFFIEKEQETAKVDLSDLENLNLCIV
jgi:hypothetical protein